MNPSINCISNIHYDILSKRISEQNENQQKLLDISSNYEFNNYYPFVRNSDFNSKKKFKLFHDESEDLDNKNRFGVTVSKFVKENWDISVNYDEFNNFSPFVRDSDFTIKKMQCYFIINNTNSPTYITFPNPSDYPHYWNRKEIILKNLHNQPILSKNNDIKQLNSKEISNKILPIESSGKYISLTTNGTNWVIKSIF